MTPPLARLRVRLTLWYAGALTVTLLLLSGGLWLAIRRQISHRLDASLVAATAAVMRATHTLEAERAGAGVADAVEELHIPDRQLYLFDGDGQPVTPDKAPDWVLEAAREAARTGLLDRNHDAGDRKVRLHAERFAGSTGRVYVAAVTADRLEVESQYGSLIGTFAGAAFVALLLVAGGGYALARKSTAPVERSMEQMRRFMADAAHELRTPVTILKARAELALARDPGSGRGALAGIAQEADRLGAIVGDLLTLARADAGEPQVTSQPLFLDDVAAGAVEAVRALAETKGVTLEVGEFEEARMSGDPTLVRRLLLIVLDNAIKYTPAGGHVRLDVAATEGRPRVTISDTGPGIPVEQRSRVFERFYRGEGARQAAEGAGLGLAIARWITDLHRGQIELIDAAPGTRVVITFPAIV